jgi:LPXTG-site transpeptidase (sortase) family protein
VAPPGFEDVRRARQAFGTVRRSRSLEWRLLAFVSTGCLLAGVAFLVWPIARIALTAHDTGEVQAAALAAWDHQGPRWDHNTRDTVLVLEIPRLGIRRFVPNGATVAHLRQYGVAHISWTAFPPVEKVVVTRPARTSEPSLPEIVAASPILGSQAAHGIVAIAGHRTTYGAPFFHIGELRPGDEIVLLYDGWRDTYLVSRQMTVRPSDVSVLEHGAFGVALVSCTPPYSAAYRLIVFGQLNTATALAQPKQDSP